MPWHLIKNTDSKEQDTTVTTQVDYNDQLCLIITNICYTRVDNTESNEQFKHKSEGVRFVFDTVFLSNFWEAEEGEEAWELGICERTAAKV